VEALSDADWALVAIAMWRPPANFCGALAGYGEADSKREFRGVISIAEIVKSRPAMGVLSGRQ